MSLLRRIVVVGIPQIRDVAQELAQDVFVADDLAEATEIIKTIDPDMIVFGGTLAPARIHELLQGMPAAPHGACATVAVLSSDSPFPEGGYRQAGVWDCLVGEENWGRLRDLAARIHEAAQQHAVPPPGDGPYFVDEIAAAVALAGRSPAVEKTMQMIRLVASSPCNPVLILGDTGTGKEVAARAIHRVRHPGRPFVAVNCAALTATLLESELFGHVKGSFTGADRDKMGLLEIAGDGTLFLDEISEMPLELQAKLLRLLQEKTFRKVGGVRDLDCRATLIASSNRDLKKEVREKRFRQDLYYRLNICPIFLAPLRSPERRQDIPLLANYFLKTSSIGAHKPNGITAITGLALEALCRHDWPGNVRELRNVVERALLLETTNKIGLSSIVIDSLDSDDTSPHGFGHSAKDFSLEKAERELIARALHETGWQKTQAAALLGITRATLYAKVKQYDLHRQGHVLDETPGAAAVPAETAALATS